MKHYIGNNRTVDILAYEKSHKLFMREKTALLDVEHNDSAFYIGDLGDVIHKYIKWKAFMPRVHPFYAVKCNDDHAVLQVLADLGASFDCASKSEIQKVLKIGMAPKRIIYANPCKQTSFIRYAKKHNVATMTFDNEAELHKIKSIYPEAKLVLRVLPPSDFKVQCELGIKFGCHPKRVQHLLETAKKLDLNLMGISFHVGSGCQDARAYEAAIMEARLAFDAALNLGFNMTLLDIGGGFPGQKNVCVSFEEIAQVVNDTLDAYFPEDSGIDIIAEPGRYFVASAFTLAVNVIAKRVVPRDKQDQDETLTANDEPAFMYYVNDGVYGSFNCLLYDHASVTPHLIQDRDDEPTFVSSVWGPTCDGLDCILEECQLPVMTIGDWMYFEDMGAYTMCAGSGFNGMPKPRCTFYSQDQVWYELYPKMQKTKRRSAKMMIHVMKAGHSIVDAVEMVEEITGSPKEEILIYPDF